ncbi:MAG: DUF2309 domain-containing protein [Nitrospira sp.]|nr:DUF2309 domain-containing protein [Nitrospira sp.]
MTVLSPEQREQVRRVIGEAHEPIAQFWPMKTFIHHNPIHGLETLPFDRAIREAQQLSGGNGYLPNEQYRQCYREGRITETGVKRALARVGTRETASAGVHVGGRLVTAADVWRLHLAFGIDPLDPALLSWALSGGDATSQFRHDLPDDARRRIIERTIRECEQCGDRPEETCLTKLWACSLSVLALSDTGTDGQESRRRSEGHAGEATHQVTVALPAQRTIGDWVDTLADVTLVEQINDHMIKWTTAFVDEGLAGWAMPGRGEGFYQAWRNLARWDHSGRLLGIRHFAHKVRALPENPEDAVVSSLSCLGIPEERRGEYLARHLAQLPGWAGFIRWRGENPAYHAQRVHPIDPVQYLAVRLFYEVESVHVVCRQEWGIDGTVPAITDYWRTRPDEYASRMGLSRSVQDADTHAICRDAWRLFQLAQCLEWSPLDMQDLARSDAQQMLEWLDAFPPDQHGPVWLEAYEEVYREQLLEQLTAPRGNGAGADSRPLAQLVCCIDVRSESFRRHVEAQGPYETFGFAGFFGIPISHQAFDDEERLALCPVLIAPGHAVTETARGAQSQTLQRYASGTRWRHLGHLLFHDLKASPVGSLIAMDLLGLFFSLGLIGKTLMLRPYHAMQRMLQSWFAVPVATQIAVDQPAASSQDSGDEAAPVAEQAPSASLASGFSLDEQATFIEGGLRMMGLTGNFGRFIVLCGHGSLSDNNPYAAALDCGACGGNHGDPNARVFAAMANNPAVRDQLRARGLAVPDDTWFLAGKHNTTTDQVTFCDLEALPPGFAADFQTLARDLRLAGAAQALERCHRIPGAPAGMSSERAFVQVECHSLDWANPRPEWGLSGNAAFLIARRRLTRGLNLGGRVFLHSYDPDRDPEGAILTKIMLAPLVVAEWINMEHYFSSVDPWMYGSGSKVIHNVVSGIGVMLGSQSDLQTGLPLQTVKDGDRPYHEPMRLLAVIEAPPGRISAIIQQHDLLQQLFHNQWLNLVALDPGTGLCHRYHPDATWELTGSPLEAMTGRESPG